MILEVREMSEEKSRMERILETLERIAGKMRF
jgi:hypothetical protein